MLYVAAMFLGASGCAMTFDGRSLGVPVSMAAPASQPMVGDTFQVTQKAVYLAWGLYPVKTPSLRSVLAGQSTGGAGVQNLRIRVHRSWSDLLFTVLTIGTIAPVSVTFEGLVTPPVP